MAKSDAVTLMLVLKVVVKDVFAVTVGAVGAVVSIVIAKLPLADQLPAASRSWTYKVWAVALRAVPGV